MHTSLVNIENDDFDVICDIKYATKDNFTHDLIYKKPGCYLHPNAAGRFKEAIHYAGKLGYKFRVFDAFRPVEAQQALWNDTPDPNFISNPNGGVVPHCRAIAIDLTLCDATTHEDLNMGTGFDAFTPLSYHGVTEISKEALANRLLLLGIMTNAGWNYNPKEWWHYQLHDALTYPILSDSEMGTNMM